MSHYRQLWRALEDASHRGPGQLTPEQRAGSHNPSNAPEGAERLVTLLQGRAAEISDEDVRLLTERGWSDDRIFEFIVSGSVHAGTRRFEAGMAALRGEEGV